MAGALPSAHPGWPPGSGRRPPPARALHSPGLDTCTSEPPLGETPLHRPRRCRDADRNHAWPRQVAGSEPRRGCPCGQAAALQSWAVTSPFGGAVALPRGGPAPTLSAPHRPAHHHQPLRLVPTGLQTRGAAFVSSAAAAWAVKPLEGAGLTDLRTRLSPVCSAGAWPQPSAGSVLVPRWTRRPGLTPRLGGPPAARDADLPAPSPPGHRSLGSCLPDPSVPDLRRLRPRPAPLAVGCQVVALKAIAGDDVRLPAPAQTSLWNVSAAWFSLLL